MPYRDLRWEALLRSLLLSLLMSGLVAFVAEQASFAKVRPDMSVVFVRELPSVQSRLKIATDVLRSLVKIAERGKKAA